MTKSITINNPIRERLDFIIEKRFENLSEDEKYSYSNALTEVFKKAGIWRMEDLINWLEGTDKEDRIYEIKKKEGN